MTREGEVETTAKSLSSHCFALTRSTVKSAHSEIPFVAGNTMRLRILDCLRIQYPIQHSSLYLQQQFIQITFAYSDYRRETQKKNIDLPFWFWYYRTGELILCWIGCKRRPTIKSVFSQYINHLESRSRIFFPSQSHTLCLTNWLVVAWWFVYLCHFVPLWLIIALAKLTRRMSQECYSLIYEITYHNIHANRYQDNQYTGVNLRDIFFTIIIMNTRTV